MLANVYTWWEVKYQRQKVLHDIWMWTENDRECYDNELDTHNFNIPIRLQVRNEYISPPKEHSFLQWNFLGLV